MSEPEPKFLVVAHAEEWVPADELRTAALAVLGEERDVVLELNQVSHLDASALQVLLALNVELKSRGHQLRLMNSSPQLQQWFAYAGVAEVFS